jgi:hypothetical protein
MSGEEVTTKSIVNNAVVKQEYAIEQCAMDTESLIAQAKAVQTVMKSVMKEDVHYGIVPGSKKPSLYKPGAEKLCMVFRLRPEFIIERENLPNGHREYEITCNLYSIASGILVGQGVGCCSTMASKYRYRNAGRTCPLCKAEDTIIKGKEEYGGGWVCFARKGGCGKKWVDDDPAIIDQHPGKVEHPDPADYYNTIKKMSKKSAMIDAVLTATAASDIFTQDVEDMKDILGISDDENEKNKLSGNEKLKRDLQNKQNPVNDNVKKMVTAFWDEFGISQQELEGYLGHSLNSIIKEEVADLRRVFSAMFAGDAKWSQFYNPPKEDDDAANEEAGEDDGSPPPCKSPFDPETGEQIH